MSGLQLQAYLRDAVGGEIALCGKSPPWAKGRGRGSVTPDMALRLFKAFNTTPELRLNKDASLQSKRYNRIFYVPKGVNLQHRNGNNTNCKLSELSGAPRSGASVDIQRQTVIVLHIMLHIPGGVL